MTYPIDLYNIRETQEERIRKRLARFHRRQMRIMARKNNVDKLFNV